MVLGPRIRSGLDRFMGLASMEYGWYNYNKSQDIRSDEEILTKSSLKFPEITRIPGQNVLTRIPGHL